MKNPNKYIINNPHVVAKYSLIIMAGLLLALVCTALNKIGLHVWLADAIATARTGAEEIREMLIKIGHNMYFTLTLIGLIAIGVGTAPFVLDLIATYKLGKTDKE